MRRDKKKWKFHTVKRDAGWTAVDYQLPKSFRGASVVVTRHGVRGSEDATPALAKEVETSLSQSQMIDEVVQLADKQLKGPELGIAVLLPKVG